MKPELSIEAAFTPADFEALARTDLRGATCVVFDVLRATSSMVTALANGAEAIIPVQTIREALELRKREPDILLAGERDGLRITPELTGSIGFDLGNSPREFSGMRVRGKRITMTTTNGTRALRACIKAERVYVASLLNLQVTARAVLENTPSRLVLVCSGTFEEAAYEDVLAAGALFALVEEVHDKGAISDSALIARKLYKAAAMDLERALSEARNGSRLLSRPDLAGDVAFCAQRDVYDIIAKMDRHGEVRKV